MDTLSLTAYTFEKLMEGSVTRAGANPFFALAGKTILVVEDNEDMFEFIERFLKLANMDVVHACNGADAVKKALILNPDVVLMDLFMPILDGYNATKQLREAGFNNPIIAISAYEEDRMKCLENDFDDLITKPVNRMRLLYVISIHLMHPEGNF